ncbi:glycosyltransferase family 4 protein [Candidatus Woesearchaeota archaeon]|nr:glycosyltransferase family 4 protein [Candidatus Woesearchaeota archaeon]
MRILVLNYEFPPIGGGASPVSFEISKGLVELGHTVDVVTMGYEQLKRKEKNKGITIYRVPSIRQKKDICHPHEMLSYVLSAKYFLKKLLKRNDYDVCHCHFIVPTGWIALWLKKNYNIPYLITSHGSDVLGHNKNGRFNHIYPLISPSWRRIMESAALIIAPSAYLKHSIEKHYSGKNTTVLHNGIDTTRFQPSNKKKYILCVSRLFKNKGLQDLIDSFGEIDQDDWKLVIVGSGPYENELRQRALHTKNKDRIDFKGWIDHKSDALRNLYSEASVFVMPSYFENLSSVLLEAMSSGCHVIATDVGGNPEIVNKDFLYNPGDTNHLTKLIKDAMHNPIPTNIKPKFTLPVIIKEYEHSLIEAKNQ